MIYLVLPLGSHFGWGVCGKYIARELAERMGGTLAVGSAPGRGTAFVLTLPRP